MKSELGKGDQLGKYTLQGDFRVAGGRSRIAFAKYGDKTWFVKEFLSPKYPTDSSPGSPKTKEYKRRMCEEFETHQLNIMSKTQSACCEDSNLVCAKELIRVGAKYYKISPYVDTSTLTPKQVSQLAFRDIQIILRSLVSSIRILHAKQIVHGDLKPDNILIKKTDSGIYTTKLIDFDDSYFSGEPPKDREAVVGTPEYYSPEVYRYITDEDEHIAGSTLTVQSDVYTLGLLFCEYLTGIRPSNGGDYAYTATLKGESLVLPISANLTHNLRQLIKNMLDNDPTQRPNIGEVFDALRRIDLSFDPKTMAEDTLAAKPTLKTRVGSAAATTSSTPTPVETSVRTAKPTLKGKLIRK